MSTQLNAETAMKTALQSVAWVVPASAALILPSPPTSFKRIDTNQFGDQVDATQMPYVRIHIPDISNHTMTQGGDAGSIKMRNYTIFLFVYWGTWVKNWDGGGDYYKTIIDATMDYFNAHRSAPGQVGYGVGQPSILGWNLKSNARVELPERYEDFLYFRSTIGIDTTEVII